MVERTNASAFRLLQRDVRISGVGDFHAAALRVGSADEAHLYLWSAGRRKADRRTRAGDADRVFALSQSPDCRCRRIRLPVRERAIYQASRDVLADDVP